MHSIFGDIFVYTSNFNTLIQSKVQIFQLFAVGLLCAIKYWICWTRDTIQNCNSNLYSHLYCTYLHQKFLATLFITQEEICNFCFGKMVWHFIWANEWWWIYVLFLKRKTYTRIIFKIYLISYPETILSEKFHVKFQLKNLFHWQMEIAPICWAFYHSWNDLN